ncbi:hypothetical protein [Pasteurella phage Pm86]|nr:hypothetical protein [Pasteurella phage Pm86]
MHFSFSLLKTLKLDAFGCCNLRLSVASHRIAACGLRFLCIDSSLFLVNSFFVRLRISARYALIHPYTDFTQRRERLSPDTPLCCR